MEMTRVLIDTEDPCPGCGAVATVFLRALDDDDWFEEARQCFSGCDEVASVIAASSPARPKRRRKVA
jgi:hypothetical protein